jgi:3-dehydroquinate synthase
VKRSKVLFSDDLPEKFDFENSILLFDKILLQRHGKWIQRFPRNLPLRSGESLKDIGKFPTTMRNIVEFSEGLPAKQIKIVSFGGGSVGDFAGFVASVLKRGVTLIHIPSTWLAAMDSSHGGKNAMNVASLKNQLGTFYPAKEIHLVKKVLTHLPEKHLRQSLGEYYKIALIDGGQLWRRASSKPSLNSEWIWRELPLMIKGKMKVVERDFNESKGIRHILNLGHTTGHILEGKLGLSHGESVLFGLRFSYEFGRRLRLTKNIPDLEWMLPPKKDLSAKLRQAGDPLSFLAQDKKLSKNGKVRFIFFNTPGKPLIRELPLSQIAQEWKRQSQ